MIQRKTGFARTQRPTATASLPAQAPTPPPSWFDPNFYFEFYNDIKAYYKSIDASILYQHYVEHGRKEGRFPSKHSMEAFSNLYPAKKPTTENENSVGGSESQDNSELPTFIQNTKLPEETGVVLTRKSSSTRLNVLKKPAPEGVRGFRLRVPSNINLENRAKQLDFVLPYQSVPKLSILMVTYNHIDCTMVCLESLMNLRNEVPFELLVWDNGSSDSTVQILEQVRGLTLIRNAENLHFLRAVNSLAPLAKGQFTLLLNNDTQVVPGGFKAALDTFERIPACSIVGAKVILRETGRLQEAGSVFLSGSPHGYGRGENPASPEFNFERAVPYTSGCSLLIRTEVFKSNGYLDIRYSPAYFEETDLCVRLLKQGHLIYYQPEFVVYHEEGASASKEYDPNALMQKNSKIFKETHSEFLTTLPRTMLEARSFRPQSKAKRILWIESEMPDPLRGSGYPRMAGLLTWLVNDGWHITYHTLWGGVKYSSELPFGVEYFAKADIPLSQLVKQRSGYYGLAIISRTPTVQAYRHLIDNRKLCGEIPVIYDMETLAGLRELQRAKFHSDSTQAKAESMLSEDLSYAKQMSGVVVVSPAERRYVVNAGGTDNCFSLGHIFEIPSQLPSYPFENRFGLLFVGFSDFEGSPNIDSLEWFVRQVLPLIVRQLPNVFLSVVGKVLDRLNKELSQNPHVRLYGQVSGARISEVIDQHRVFVAPTRFASGIPHKCHTAASSGLPIVCTDILAEQLAWNSNQVISVPIEAPAFAQACVRLHSERELWQQLQKSAFSSVSRDCSADQMFNFRDWLLTFNH